MEVIDSETDEEERDHDTTIIALKNSENLFSVFVTYVQIYNNNVYDLLDDNTLEYVNRNVVAQPKILREDSSKKEFSSWTMARRRLFSSMTSSYGVFQRRRT